MLLLARHAAAREMARDRLASGTLWRKVYWALVHGRPRGRGGIVNMPLMVQPPEKARKKAPARRGETVTPAPAFSGGTALTEWRVLKTSPSS